jgi:hypothetical protein
MRWLCYFKTYIHVYKLTVMLAGDSGEGNAITTSKPASKHIA